MIGLTGISLQYGGVHAVNDVNLDVEPGSRLALIGPNGAGKSSLLSLIGGQARASSGRIKLGSTDVTRAHAYRRANLGIARSFQITNLMPKLTVRQQTTLAMHRPTGRGRVRRNGQASSGAVERLLAEWAIPAAQWDEKPSGLSYGQQRSLELAMAMARKPNVLLLDEPNVGLTGSENAELIARINGLDRDTTVLLVAHDMDMVFGFAERIIVMERGAIAVDGGPEEVRNSQVVADIYIGGAEW